MTTPQWTPEWERKFQFVQQQYNLARSIGIDVLKFYLQVVIAIIVIPIIFHQQTFVVFGDNISYIYTSWIYIVVSVLLGVLAYGMTFEGYFHQAHREYHRHLDTSQSADKSIEKLSRQSNLLFEVSHWSAIASFTSFGIGLIFFIVGVVKAILAT